MASKNNINSVFTDIANSIRAKKGTTNTIQPINMAEEIDGIITGITPSGKIVITNTEEINVTNYATAQVVDSNLSAENIKEGVSILGKVGTYKGSGEDATFKEALQPVIDEYEEKMKVTYNKTYDTTDNVTIYSPAENAKYYFITQRSSGVFRIIWSNKPCAYVDSGGGLDCLIGMFRYLDSISYIKFDCNELEKTNLTKHIKFNSNYYKAPGTTETFKNAYYSANYNSIEECIEALKSKITYTYASDTSFGGEIYSNNTSVILTNGVEVTSNYEINNCGRQLSSNETIVVM